ncbi:hypothetical protein E0500_033230 [Streptomyces sp. KM273126]|uniref:hypothetical protein n=1 Tax=Streptomyces sp. KM273126 TaxID=2545247 RepID=UPI0015EB384A|nr:hypothetical protein [Streptomyces sp. KM273126]MBA2812053.1 hypothetical protein [Streptomyces sp. KM273126]
MGDYEEDGRRYVSLTGLRARGWTGGMIHRLLGPPDRLALNPRFRAAPPRRLYRIERVEAAERSEEFRVVAEAAARRSEAVRAALRRRQEEVLERIRAEPLDVPRLNPDKLELRAVEHRTRSETKAGPAEGAGAVGGHETTPTVGRPTSGPGEHPTPTPSLDPSSGPGPDPDPTDLTSLDAWKVDYLRQRLFKQYGRLLDGIPGGASAALRRAEAVALLNQRIHAAIAEAHPGLAQECEKRMSSGHGPAPGGRQR